MRRAYSVFLFHVTLNLSQPWFLLLLFSEYVNVGDTVRRNHTLICRFDVIQNFCRLYAVNGSYQSFIIAFTSNFVFLLHFWVCQLVRVCVFLGVFVMIIIMCIIIQNLFLDSMSWQCNWQRHVEQYCEFSMSISIMQLFWSRQQSVLGQRKKSSYWRLQGRVL